MCSLKIINIVLENKLKYFFPTIMKGKTKYIILEGINGRNHLLFNFMILFYEYTEISDAYINMFVAYWN